MARASSSDYKPNAKYGFEVALLAACELVEKVPMSGGPH
jgi:hypothetical protein